jgi:hypothetical protein
MELNFAIVLTHKKKINQFSQPSCVPYIRTHVWLHSDSFLPPYLAYQLPIYLIIRYYNNVHTYVDDELTSSSELSNGASPKRFKIVHLIEYV